LRKRPFSGVAALGGLGFFFALFLFPYWLGFRSIFLPFVPTHMLSQPAFSLVPANKRKVAETSENKQRNDSCERQ
jgi:hypothetical protein